VPPLADITEYYIKKVFATAEPVMDVEFSAQLQTSKRVQYWLYSFYPLFFQPNAKGKKVDAVSSVVKEITELKEKEEALLSEKERVEEANNAKSRFLAHISHELRTPMSCVLGKQL
jgi:signal transduction histidine kinase